MNINYLEYGGKLAFIQAEVNDLDCARVLLPEIRKEINEIYLVLMEANLEDPLAEPIETWYTEITAYLSPHQRRDHAPMTAVLKGFVESLELILKDPRPDADPYPPALYGNGPIPLVRFIVGRMCDPSSVLYSQTLFLMLPPDTPLPPATYKDFKAFLESDALFVAFEAQLRVLDAAMEARRIEEEAHMPNLQAARGRIRQIQDNHRLRLERVNNVAQARLQNVADDIQNLRQRHQAEVARGERFIEEMDGQVRVLDFEIGQLQAKINTAKADSQIIELQLLQIEQSIKQVEASLRKSQKKWFSSLVDITISIAVTWVLSKALPGSGMVFSNKAPMLQKVFPLPF